MLDGIINVFLDALLDNTREHCTQRAFSRNSVPKDRFHLKHGHLSLKSKTKGAHQSFYPESGTGNSKPESKNQRKPVFSNTRKLSCMAFACKK